MKPTGAVNPNVQEHEVSEGQYDMMEKVNGKVMGKFWVREEAKVVISRE